MVPIQSLWHAKDNESCQADSTNESCHGLAQCITRVYENRIRREWRRLELVRLAEDFGGNGSSRTRAAQREVSESCIVGGRGSYRVRRDLRQVSRGGVRRVVMCIRELQVLCNAGGLSVWPGVRTTGWKRKWWRMDHAGCSRTA